MFQRGNEHVFASLPARPDTIAMSHFMHHNPVLVAAFGHVRWSMRPEPDNDAEISLLSPDVLIAIAKAAEFSSWSCTGSSNPAHEWMVYCCFHPTRNMLAPSGCPPPKLAWVDNTTSSKRCYKR